MTCRSCGTEIADKAIVCYRCGTPTAESIARAPAPAARAGWRVYIVVVVIMALGAWLIPKTTPGTPPRIAAWVVTWLLLFAAFALSRRGRGR